MPSSTHSGFRYNHATSALELYANGTLVCTFTATGVTFAQPLSVPQAMTIGGIAYTFPADNGDAGEQLQTDGSGVLTWEAAST